MAVKKRSKVLAEVLYLGPDKKGRASGRVLKKKKLTTSAAISIGRSKECDFVIPAKTIAPIHSIITSLAKQDHAILMVDVDTKNGTKKTGIRRFVHYLRKGDEVIVADNFRFMIR